MVGPQLRARLATFESRVLFLSALVATACSADHLVSVEGGSQRVSVAVGGLVDISLWDDGVGMYASPPDISAPVVEFVDVSIDVGSNGIITPGGPSQRFRFRAVSRGTAIVTFSPLQNAPVVSDTIVVQ